jgi:ATP-binding protein involved in chromosome partitioning
LVDPRVSIIEERIRPIRNVVAVSSGKGGVGKSLVASTLALTLARKGYRVGLFDLDFTSPSTHAILGIEGLQPKEEKGIVPPEFEGLEYMSIIYYTGDYATPLRGVDTSNVLLELLSITRWGKLDYLILDMPPGIGDAILDLIRFLKRTKILVVTTPSQLAFETVKKLTALLKELDVPIVGLVENMKMDQSNTIQEQTLKLGLTYLGKIPYDSNIEESIGNTSKLLKTEFARKMEQIASEI